MNKKDEITLYAYDFDNTLFSTEYSKKGVNPYDKLGDKLFGEDNYRNGVKLFTNLTFDDLDGKSMAKFNLQSKGKFYKLMMIYDALKNGTLTIDDVKKSAKNFIEKDKKDFAKFENFITDLKNDNFAENMKKSAVELIEKIEEKFNDESLIFGMKKNKWNLWNFVSDKYSNKYAMKLLLEDYKKKIMSLKNNISMKDAIEKIFFPTSALYEIFGNETARVNLDLMNKIINHSKNENSIQYISSLKDKGTLIENMKIFEKIGNEHLKKFIKVFYNDKKDNMIIGTTKNSSKRRKIRSLELLYYPKIRELIKNKTKINYVVIGDSVGVDKKNNAEPGKDNFTLTNILNLTEDDLKEFKELLKNEYKYSDEMINSDENLKNIDSLKSYLNNISLNFVYETRLMATPKVETNDFLELNKSNIDYDNIQIFCQAGDNSSKKENLSKALKIIANNENDVEQVMKSIDKKIDNVRNYETSQKEKNEEKRHFNLIGKNNKNVKIHFNVDKDDVRPLKSELFNKDRNLKKKLYGEFVRKNKITKSCDFDGNNFNKFLYNKAKKFNNHEKLFDTNEDKKYSDQFKKNFKEYLTKKNKNNSSTLSL